MHLVITDSGLGGLSVCAGLEQALGGSGVRLTYVNAWPEEGRGYNDLVDVAARAAVFDRVLARIAALRPDAILIACNTLSIVYEHTAFRAGGEVPVHGIIDAGLQLFGDALSRDAASSLVLIGTRTTIESGVHRDRLVGAGIDPARMAGASCHGLATAIEHGPDSAATAALIAACGERAAAVAAPGDPLFLGLACTHYGMVAARLAQAVAERVHRGVTPLDPNGRMVADVVARFVPAPVSGGGTPAVDIISKVELSREQRDGVARVIELTSPATAAALRAYTHEPDFF